MEQQPERRVKHTGRDRDAYSVVDEGEEKVLADVAHRRAAEPYRTHDPPQVALRPSIATSVRVPIAIPTSAAARAGASLMPSPAIATTRPASFSSSTTSA